MGLLGAIKSILYTNSDLVNGGFDVNPQDSTAPIIALYLMTNAKDDITLTSNVSIDDNIFNVSSGHGFAPGDTLFICDSNRFLQADVLSVATNAITLNTLSDYTFQTATSSITRGSKDMAVDGSSTPLIFELFLNCFTIPVDYKHVVITMQHGSNVPDDGKFGGLSALANGLFVRKIDGNYFNLGNYQTNQDFTDKGAEVVYSDKAPSGTNGTRVIFKVKDVFGQVIRMGVTTDEKIQAIVRDDLSPSAGMAKMTVSFLGSYTTGEA